MTDGRASRPGSQVSGASRSQALTAREGSGGSRCLGQALTEHGHRRLLQSARLTPYHGRHPSPHFTDGGPGLRAFRAVTGNTDVGARNLLGHSLPSHCDMPQFPQLGNWGMLGPTWSGAGTLSGMPAPAVPPLSWAPPSPEDAWTSEYHVSLQAAALLGGTWHGLL